MKLMNANVSPLTTMIYKDFSDAKSTGNVTKIREFDTVSGGFVTNLVTEKKSKKMFKKGV